MSEKDDDTFEIVTTAPGTFGPEGVAKVGAKRFVTLEEYSTNWMVPANGAAQIKLKKLMAAAGKKADEQTSS